MGRLLPELWASIERASVLETDTPELRRRNVTLVVVAILSCFMGILSAVNTYAISGLLRDIAIPLSFTAVVGLSLLLFLTTKRFSILLYPFLFMMLWTPVVFQWSAGGFSAPGALSIILWSLLAPLGALMFQGTGKAVGWFVAYVVLVVSTLFLDEILSLLATPVAHEDMLFAQGMNIIGLSITVFVTMRYFVSAFEREHARTEQLVVELTESNTALNSALGELRETQAELVQSAKMAGLGKLAAGIAHEINNPMGALSSAADSSARCVARLEELLAGDEASAGTGKAVRLQRFLGILKDNTRVLSSASERVTRTVGSFIGFSRLDGAEFDVVDLHEGLDNTLTLFRSEIPEKVEVIKQYGDIPRIACYPAELNQVFMALLRRAVHGMPGEGTITIRTRPAEGSVDVEIADNGAGLSDAEIGELFDPHFQQGGSRVQAGLELFAAHRIVEKHQGRIVVESEVGRGSSFTVVLPTDLERGSTQS